MENQNPTNACGNCGKETALRCGRCRSSWYCSSDCQKAHYSVHKTTCNLDQTIHRAGQLLQEVVFVFSELCYPYKVVKIQDEGNELWIYDAPNSPGRFYKFPNHLVANEKDKKMILTTLWCTEAHAYLHDFVNEMLKGLCCQLREIMFEIKAPSRRTKVRAWHGDMNAGREWLHHEVLEVTSPAMKKTWIIDTTGAQYGIFDPVEERSRYNDLYVDMIIRTNEWGASKETVLRLARDDDPCAPTWFEAAGVVHRTVEAWKVKTSLTLRSLLRQPESSYSTNRRLLLDDLEKALSAFMQTKGVKD